MPFGNSADSCIEDDVLVTDTGSRVLTAAIPKSITEIESLRAEAFES